MSRSGVGLWFEASKSRARSAGLGKISRQTLPKQSIRDDWPYRMWS